MTISDYEREKIKQHLWREADKLHWENLSAFDKSRHYAIWTETPTIGGRLSAFMDARRVRVYIKDTLLKEYMKEKMSDHARIFRSLGIRTDAPIKKEFIKPHGRILEDDRLICWGRAVDWKSTLIAVYERAYLEQNTAPFAAVLVGYAARYSDDVGLRCVVESVSARLGIEKLVWLES